MAEPTLVLEAVLEPQALALRYTVRNPLPNDIYLMNRIPDGQPQTLAPDHAWVELLPESALVQVYKGAPGFPAGFSGPPVPVSPQVTPVRSGATFVEVMRLKLPVRIHRAYGRSPEPARDDRLETYQGVLLQLQWYAREPGVREMEQQYYGTTVLIPTGFPRIPPVHLLQSAPVPVAVPVAVPAGLAPPPRR